MGGSTIKKEKKKVSGITEVTRTHTGLEQKKKTNDREAVVRPKVRHHRF